MRGRLTADEERLKVKARIKQFVPRPIKRLGRHSIRRLELLIDDFRLFSLIRTYKRRYGKGFIATIHHKDEMFRFSRWRLNSTESDAAVEYLKSGESMLIDVEEIFADLGYTLGGVRSFLEFASGYGRFIRFLVRRLDSSRITVTDIDHSAVDFTHNTFGVKSFYSVAEANQLIHDETYDVIFVGSLFSHLALPFWGAWLRRLFSMLNDRGILMFSTHGMNPYDAAAEKGSKKADGFYFVESNETIGRLSGDYYGTAYVSEDYVRRFVSSEAVGKVIGFYPDKLCDFQDVYVIEKEGLPTGARPGS